MAGSSADKFETWGESEGRQHVKKFHDLTDSTATSTYVAEEVWVTNDTAHPLNVTGISSGGISGQSSVTQGTVPWVVAGSATVGQGPASSANPWFIQNDSSHALFISGGTTDVTAKQGTPSSLNPWFIQNDSSHAITVQGNTSAVVSGNTTVIQGTSPWIVGGNATVAQGAGSSLSPWFIANDSSHALFVQGTTDVTAKQGAASSVNPWFIQNDSSHAITIQGNATVAISGNATVAQGAPSSANPWFVQNDSSHVLYAVEDVSVPVRTNLAYNPSAEVDATGWTNDFGSIARTSVVSRFGDFSIKAQAPAGSSRVDAYPVVSSALNGIVKEGDVVTISVYVYSTDGAGGVFGFIEWRNAAGGTISTPVGSTFAVSANQWTRVWMTATAPPLAVNMDAGVQNNSVSTSGGSIYVDGLLIEKSSVPLSYFDGAFPGSPQTTWLGTVHGSQSQLFGANLVAQGPASSLNPWFIQNDSSHAITVQGNTTVVQGTKPWRVDSALDSTRVEVALLFIAAMTTTPTNMQFRASTNFVQSTVFATDYVISSGRSFYIQSMDLSLAAFSTIAGGRSYSFSLQVGYLTGATTLAPPSTIGNSSNSVWQITIDLGEGGGLAVADIGNQYHVEFPQGIRIPAGSSASHLALAGTQDNVFTLLSSVQFTGTLNGFEYF